MTVAPAPAGRGRAAAEPRVPPALEPDEALWLERYLDRLKKAPGGLLKRLVVYGSKARGDAGPESDVDVLVLVGDTPNAVPTARGLSYDDDDPDTVDHGVVVRTEADWLRDLDRELPFPRNVEAQGVQIHPVYRPPRRPPGDLPPVTRKGVRHAVPLWLKEARSNLEVLEHYIEWLKDGWFRHPGNAARPAFDAVFFSTMAWCLVRGVSVVRRRDLPASVEQHLIEPGVLDSGWRDRIRTLWEAWKAEVDWRPGRQAEPTIENAAGWAGTAREFCRLAREAVAADGIDVDPPDDAGGAGDDAGAAEVP